MQAVVKTSAEIQHEIYNQLAVLGPAEHPALQDLENVNKLCDRCRDANWEAVQVYVMIAGDAGSMYPLQPLYDTLPTIAHVKASSYAGCHFCSLVLAVLQSCRYRYSIDIDIVPVNLEKVTENSPVDVSVLIADAPPFVRLRFRLPPHDSDDDQAGCCNLVSLDIAPDPALVESDVNFSMKPENLARCWLTDCLASHDLCTHPTSNLPRRVIDVSGDPLRLVMLPDLKANYAAVSYTIGGAHLVTTTSQNIDSRQQGFDMDILPQALQDCIWWTRQLGIMYVWIDSLCILQDALSDWELELSTMSEIYRNSTITIAAGAIHHANQRCRPRQNKLTTVPCRVRQDIVILPDADRVTWLFDKAPVDRRAWCMQEVELSQRVLRVGCEELAWQCRNGKRLESHVWEELVHEFGYQTPGNGGRILDNEGRTRIGGVGHEVTKKRPFNVWYSLVSRFARKQLSFPADRLPALSGLAQYYQKKWHGSYLAGLWKEDIFHGLLWTMVVQGNHVNYRGPSWSWAAVEGGWVGWYHALLGSDDSLFELLEVRTVVEGLNPFGRVRSAKMTLLASVTVLPACCLEDESTGGDVPLWNRIMSVHLLRWDRGKAEVGCILLRLHKKAFLVLQPNTKHTYCRVGALITPSEIPTEAYKDIAVTVDMLAGLEWNEEVVTII